jgi:hypothetical protein
MSEGMKFKYDRIFEKENYLTNYCEDIFKNLNYKKKKLFNDFPERMVFETEIWIVGEIIREGIMNEKKDKTSNYLKIVEDIIKIITTEKYKKGRESFVMLLSFYKNNNEIENLLAQLLDDKELYGFAIIELNKLKKYEQVNKAVEIYNNEKNGWIKKEVKKYLENANKS